MKKIFLIIALILSASSSALAAHPYPERYYQNVWCSKWNGVAEYRLADKTRVDCLTKSFAVEFDFAPKWAEAVGQSLHYSMHTGKKPAIVLIIEKPSDFEYYNRVKPLCEKHNITLWYMKMPETTANAPAQKPAAKPTAAVYYADINKILEKCYEILVNYLK